VAFSDAGLFVLRNAGFNDSSGAKRLYVWDTCTGDLLHNVVRSISGDSFTLQKARLVGYMRGILSISDGRTGERQQRIELNVVDNIPFNNIISNRNGTLFVLERSDQMEVFDADFERIERLEFENSSARLLSVDDDGTILLEVERFADSNALVPQTTSREVMLLRASG
jgi:hypothetical protein